MNVFQAMAAYFVVFVHFKFPGVMGSLVADIAGFAVPFFFAVSGYFFFKGNEETEKKSIPRKITKLLKLVVISELIYFLFYVCIQIPHTGFRITAITNVIRAEFFDGYVPHLFYRISALIPVFNYAGWFIVAMIAVYLLMYVILQFSIRKPVIIVSACLLVLSCVLSGILMTLGLCANFQWEKFILFIPLPFFMMGYYIGMNKQKFSSISNRTYVLLLIFGIVCFSIARLLRLMDTMDLGTCIVVFAMMCIANKNHGYEPKWWFAKLLSHIGEKHGTTIYIMHMMIGVTLMAVMKALFGASGALYQWTLPVLVAVASTVFSVVGASINRIWKRRRKYENSKN